MLLEPKGPPVLNYIQDGSKGWFSNRRKKTDLFLDLFEGGVAGDLFRADIDYLYQDRAGTTLVTAPGDPVRSIRGQVNGHFAAVASDGHFWTYQIENDVGVLRSQANNASRGFLVSGVNCLDILGNKDDDHGFYLAGLTGPMPQAVGALYRANVSFMETGLGTLLGPFFNVARFGADDGFMISLGGVSTENRFSETNPEKYFSGYIFVNQYDSETATQGPGTDAPITALGSMLARNGNAYRSALRSSDEPILALGWTLNAEEPLDEGWSETFTTGGPITEPLEWEPPVVAPLDLSFWICGMQSSGPGVGVHFRAVLLVGKDVDPALHNIIMNAL